MKNLGNALAALVLCGMLVGGATSAAADDNDPLFVNLTNDDAFRTMMAIRFSKALMERGHPLTIFLNDRGIYLASKTHGAKYADQQKLLSELMGTGTVVIACPQCLKQFDIPESDLLPGIKVGSPELTGGALFKQGTQTLSW
jgi:sulfur relay (sulfurtransferase) complex TusBCD TusD component (DsrE family)